ncbi:MAG: nucleotidyltransferase domain-containing protein, partial [Candidatus Bathyarchaeota archaeon]
MEQEWQRPADSQIADILREEGLGTGYLYGSRARGDNREDSDYDISLAGNQFVHPRVAEYNLRIARAKARIEQLTGQSVDLSIDTPSSIRRKGGRNLAKGTGEIAHEDINEVISKGQREYLYGDIVDGEGLGDESRPASLVETEKQYVEPALEVIRNKGPPDGFSPEFIEFINKSKGYHFVLVTPEDRSPFLVREDEEHHQEGHVGLTRNAIYISKGIYNAIKADPNLLAAMLAHDAYELFKWIKAYEGRLDSEKDLSISQYRDAHSGLVSQFHLEAENVEASICGKSDKVVGSKLDEAIQDIVQRYADLRAIIGNDVDEAIKQNEQATGITLEKLINESPVPAAYKEGRKSPLEDPEALLLTGGTSGNFFTGVLPDIISTTPPTREVKLNTIISLSPFDDGGSSRRLVGQVFPYLGYIIPPGDEVNVMCGLTTARKRWVLRYRTGEDEQGLLKDKMVEVLKQAFSSRDQDGNLISEIQDMPLDPDWIMFCHHMLKLAELVDEQYIKTGRFTIGGHSVGNLFNLGMKLYTGAYNENTKQIDVQAYTRAIQRMTAILGIPDIHIFPTSFVRGSLYALLEAPTIKIGESEKVLDEKAIAQGRATLGSIRVELGRREEGYISLTINGETAIIKEEFGAQVTRGHVSDGTAAPDSRTIVIVRDSSGKEKAQEILDTKGQGLEVAIGGVFVRIRG